MFPYTYKVLLRSICLSIVLLLEISSLQAEGKYLVTFLVYRESTGIAIPNINLIVKSAKSTATTDKQGSATLSFPNIGFYEIRVVSQSKVLNFSREIRYNGQQIILYLPATEIAGINVSGERDQTKLSRYNFQQEEIKRLPGVAGDSLKAIQTVPGVSIGAPVGILPSVFTNVGNLVSGVPYSNSDRGDISLRGGGTRQNQYFFDGFPLPYPFHLGNQSSVLNNNLIRSFDIYSGAFPSRYGFATGGIIAIEGTDKVEETKTIWNLNFFLTDVYHQTKLIPSLSMVSSGRKNYPNFVLLRAYPEGIPEDAKFAEYHDFQWKLIWDISEEHKLSIQTFGSRDRQAYTKTQASLERGGEDPRPPTGLDRQFRTDAIRHIWKSKVFRHTLSYSRTTFTEFFELRFSNPLTAETIFGLQNRTSDFLNYGEQRLEWYIFEEYLKLDAGVQVRTRETNLKGENITSSNRTFFELFNNLLDSNAQFRSVIDGDRIRYQEGAAYAELQGKWKGFTIRPGMRYDTYSGSREKNLSPRLNGGYEFESTKTSFLAGHGIHYNSPVLIEQLSSKSGNPNLLMERSEHNSVGIQQELNAIWIFKVEAFRNIFQNIIVPDAFVADPYSPYNDPRLIVNDPTRAIRDPIQSRNLNYSNSGYGYSEGIEIFIKKSKDPRQESGAFGWISYTNSITKRINNQARRSSDENTDASILNRSRELLAQTKLGTNYLNYYSDNQFELIYNNDREELYDLDRRHILNVVFGYKFNSVWQVGGRYRYFSGTPYTPIVSANRANQAATFGVNLYFPEYSKNYNSDRLLPFHQFDIRIDHIDQFSWGYINFYLELVNFYGRLNQSGFNFDNLSPYQRGTNPAPIYDTVNSPYVQSQRPNGSIIYLPLINLGMEVRF
ncbi:TonB-dependent receptor plug domain protein [Leptospira ryugenii]|uniref:TonB-dependent receptor plug domain protein n=1 Tax=Leptospira ryugenii TaxID=1917863 RepID=A0A2P2E4Z9_9LEPT|nr:TonB-dependent receptor [Leptospira ryugenii]GBF51943.1 TonB-dependent receptor plug domain protein [Leptospira ryugenii]